MDIHRKHLDCVFQSIAAEVLQEPDSLYSIDGHALFEMRGAAGGIATHMVFYIVGPIKEDKTMDSYGVRVSPHLMKTYTQMKKLLELAYQNFKVSPYNVDSEGGEFGLGNILSVKE